MKRKVIRRVLAGLISFVVAFLPFIPMAVEFRGKGMPWLEVSLVMVIAAAGTWAAVAALVGVMWLAIWLWDEEG